MPLIGNYLIIDTDDLETLKDLEVEDLIEELENFSEYLTSYSLNHYWDGLHFWLTNKSASIADRQNPISQAILGQHFLINTTETLVAFNRKDELEAIISALEAIDNQTLKKKFNPQHFFQEDIYPDIWLKESKDELINSLLQELNSLIAFYQQAQTTNMNIILSIYELERP
jgi:hypothetical protein